MSLGKNTASQGTRNRGSPPEAEAGSCSAVESLSIKEQVLKGKGSGGGERRVLGETPEVAMH